jgi:hypothetical protein
MPGPTHPNQHPNPNQHHPQHHPTPSTTPPPPPAPHLHARLEVDDVKALDVDLQGHRAHARGEVEQAVAGGANPLPNILGVGQAGGQGKDADRLLQLAADVAHAAGDDLQARQAGGRWVGE